MGLMWGRTAFGNLSGVAGPTTVIYDVVIAPDNNAFWAVVTGTAAAGPTNVWITENGGGKWENTGLNAATGGALASAPWTSPWTTAASVTSPSASAEVMAVVPWTSMCCSPRASAGWPLQTASPAGHRHQLGRRLCPEVLADLSR